MKAGSNSSCPSKLAWCTLAMVLAASVLSPQANAQRERRPGAAHWRGDITRFHEHDWPLWRGGHWAHSRHDGRFGWWWVAGGAWYLYPAPVYPYPNPWEPPQVMLAPPADGAVSVPPIRYWYYCEALRMYYPYAATCPSQWKQLPAAPGDALPAQ